VVEPDSLVFRARQDLLDGGERHLRVEVVQGVTARRVEPDLLQRIGAGAVHLDDDGAVLGIDAEDAAHEHRLGPIELAPNQQRLLRLRKIIPELADLDSVGRALEQLRVGEGGDLVDERHLVLEIGGELRDAAHHLQVPGPVLEPGSLVEDVGELVRAEVLAVLLVGEEGRVGGVEVGLVAVVDAGSRRQREAPDREGDAAHQYPPTVVVGPSGNGGETLVQGGDDVAPDSGAGMVAQDEFLTGSGGAYGTRSEAPARWGASPHRATRSIRCAR
jgi:hypothetical protein